MTQTLFLFLLPLLVPTLLHLFGFHVSKKYYISSVEFLKAAFLRTKSPNRLFKVLLLVLRFSFLIALITAFVLLIQNIPSLNSNIRFNSKNSFLDNSSSVCSVKDNGQFFEAKEFNIRAKSKLGSENIACSNFSPNLTYFLNHKTEDNFMVFSDFQKSFVDEAKYLEKIQKCNLVTLKSNALEPNISVDSVWVESNYVRRGSPTKIDVVLRNNGKTENKNVLIDLRLGGKSVGSRTETMLPNATKSISFSLDINTEKEELCEIRIDDGSWTFDNSFSFVLKRTEELPLLVVSDLNVKTNPFKLAYDLESVFKCSTLNSFSNIDEAGNNQLVVFNQSGSFSTNTFQSLIEFAKNGGTVLLVPSKNWSIKEAEMFNKSFGEKVVDVFEGQMLDLELPNLQNPFFKDIFEKRPTPTDMPTVIPIWKIVGRAESILQTKIGEMAVGSIEYGKGIIYLYTFPIGEDENFSRNAIFLPILYRIAEKSIKNTAKPYCRISDDIIEFAPKSTQENKEDVYSLENGDFKIIPEQKVEGEKVKLFLPKQDLPFGFWSVKDKKGDVVLRFGLNNDKKESEVDFYSVEELKDIFKTQPNVEVISFDDFKKKEKLLSAGSDAWPLWRYAIMISFLFLLAEILVVRYYKNIAARPVKN